ncbi:MAG TPA: ATP-binding protein [Spirochaetota bacterium]|mgnify:FL=1|nr:ATP-binding protein [Spirochaetota bacterium]
MIYKNRQLEYILKEASTTFPALLLTGPRQSGKTTLLKNLFSDKAKFISLDESDIRLWAHEDPRDFIQNNMPPVIIDEIQYAPDLLTYIKRRIDDDRSPGQWFLTGSSQFTLMKHVSESLAGRTAIFHLLPFSHSEIHGRVYPNWDDWFTSIKDNVPCDEDLGNVLLRGTYPELVCNPTINRRIWYDSYIQTYIERDLSLIYNIGDINTFTKMLTLLAARTGTILNMSSLASDLGVSVPTVKRWISVLESSFILYLLKPYYANIGKRLIKSAKIYFLDTGLAAHLTGIRDREVLLRGPLSGQLFETFVVSEFVKSFYHHGERPALTFINNKNIWEVDLLIERNMNMIPVEIKLSATITENHLKNFKLLRNVLQGLDDSNYLICNRKEYNRMKGTHISYWGSL